MTLLANQTGPTDLVLCADGWCVGHAGSGPVLHLPSPNFDLRSDGLPVDLLVIHNISLPPGEFGGDAIAALFQNRLDCDAHPYFAQLRGLRVSSHFLIRRDGQIVQFVPVSRRAWHAGVSCFEGRQRCNDFSVGIEMEGTDDQPFDPRQYAALTRLAAVLCAGLSLKAITGHSFIAPQRKTDPGPCFDWAGFESGLAQMLTSADGVISVFTLPRFVVS